MQQIVELNETLREKVKSLEINCERLSKKLEAIYGRDFQKLGIHLIIELVRVQKGKPVNESCVFTENYESYIELGIEKGEEYFPNAYIPIWKCKKETFQLIGYLTDFDIQTIESKMLVMIEEMLEEMKGESGE